MVLPLFYGLASASRSWSGGNFCAMDSGANIFIFPPEYAVPGTIAPSSHCLTSATSGPAHFPLNSADVMFGLRDSVGVIRIFRQSAFIHPYLPFALFPLSLLSDQGACFDFYGTLGLQCGSMFLPFARIDGLYVAELFTVSFESSHLSSFDSDFIHAGLVAQTRSVTASLSLPVQLPDPIVSPASLLPSPEALSSDLPVVLPEPIDSSASLLPSPAALPSVSSLPASVVSFSSRLTGAGLLLLHAHRRLGHLHDRILKRMIDRGMCGNLTWVPGIIIRAHCWDCLKGQQKRNVPAPDPNLRELHPLSCQVLVWDWCGPQHVRALHGELYWFLAVCPRGYHWGAIAAKKSDFITILTSLLRHIRGKVGDDRVRYVKFDGGAEFVSEPALQVYRAWKLDFSINCPTHHWQTGPVERGHSIHQDGMRTTGSYSDTPSVLWGHNYLLSVEVHNLKLHAGADVCPYFDLTGLAPDTQFWGCLAVVHNHTANPDKFYPRGLPCIYLGTGYFEGVHGAKFLNPATGHLLFSTNMTVSEHFLPFKELVSNPAAVRDCFGILAFCNLVAWSLVNKRVRKCFNGTWCIGTIISYTVQRQWFAIKYSDGTEEYSPSELALIYYSGQLPSAFFMAFDVALPAVVALHAGTICSPLTVPPGAVSGSASLGSLINQAAYSVAAQIQIGSVIACLIHAKPAVYRRVVCNPLFPLAGDLVLIPKTDQQAQKQPCAPYWNADKELCLARHRELHAHDDVDRPSSSVQVLDTKWVFDLKINSSTRMIELFKTRIVANGQPQILGFDCYDVHAPTIPMPEIKLLLAICAHRDMELFQMDTTTAFISAALKPGELIYCNPPRGVDLGLGANGFPRVWKLRAPLEGTRPAAMRWTQSSSIPIQSFGFVAIGSGGAFWMYHHPPDEMLLCTHVDDFLLASSSLALAKRFRAHYSLHHDCKFFIAGTFVGIDIVRDRDARKMYLSQAALIDRLLEQEFAGIMSRENLSSNDLRFNPGQHLHKWEQLCPCSTPFDYKMPKLSKVDSPAIPDPVLVHRLQVVAGTLMYILNSRPDLMHSVHQVARFVHNPGPAHIKALDHILRYLAGTGDLCLIIGNWTAVDLRFLAVFHVNADASHKNVELDFRGITGVGVFALGTLLIARSFVQDQVAASSCEAEYYSYSSGVKDLEYVRLLLRDLFIFPDDAPVPSMLVDSEPAMAISQGPTHRSRTKHIDFTKALFRDYVQRGRVVPEHCPTEAQIADMWTKQVGPGPFVAYRARFMGLVPCLHS